MGILKFLEIAFYVVTTVVGIKNYKAAKKLQDQGQDILATKTAQGGKIPIIYGRRRVGSTLLYMDTDSGNSKELFVIYGLCLGEVDSIELDTIEINGVPISDTKVFRQGYYAGSDKISSGAGSLNTASQLGNVNSKTSSGRSGLDPSKRYRMVFNAHHGADDQTVDPMLNASQSTKFTSNHRLRGIAYIAASFEYDTKGMFTSVPELTVVVKGRKLYDPRLDGSITGGTGTHRIADKTTYEWSNNAALTLLDYMHQDYGKGLSASLIDLQSFQTAANTADTIVDVPDYSGSYASATFSADIEDNFITVNEATWKKIKGGELLSVKDSGGSVIINQNNVIDAQRFTPHTESTNFRIYIDDVPPAKVSKSVTFSATNGDATITVSCTSHGASVNDRVLFAGATSLGGNITATVLNKGYTIATVVDANSFTIEATDLNLTTVLANSSDTGNGGGSAVGKFMYADESGLFLAQTRRLQCDGVLDTNETVLDNARDLLSNMRGFLNYIDGKYSVLVEDATSSSFSITDDHIIDQGIKIRYEDKAEKLNKVVVQFFNAQKKYESDTKTVFHNNSTSTYKNDDGGEELETTAEFQYITNPYNAFNMGKGILERSRRQKTISFIGTPRLLNLTAGDVVTITYTPYNLSNAAYRIETINLLDNGLVGVQAIEYFDLYTWSATPPEENVGGDPDLPTGTEAEPPTNLSFTDATSSRRAFLTWSAATNYPAKEFRVVITNSSGQEVHNRIVSNDFLDLDFIAVANGYVASITSINSVGAESDAATITFNVTQQPVKLGDIQANAITANEINVTDLSAISADLGSITAGSINIGSGAFTVSSSGVMTATGATVSGAITASSLNVTGATVTGTLDASVITLNTKPLDEIFALAGTTDANRIMSLGFVANNQLKITDVGLQYLAQSTSGSGIGFESFLANGTDFRFFSTAAGNSQKETIVNKEGSITLSNLSSAPSGSAQTNSLYLLNGALQFNGSAVGTGTGDITAVVAGTNLNGGGTSGSVTLNLDSTITGNHTFSNNLIVGGDLTVQGTTTTIDTTNLDVKDKNITLNFSTGDSSANANGAGITIQDAVSQGNDATILWDATNDEFDFSHGITLPDNQKLQIGASNDLKIYHDGFQSIIQDAGTGQLQILAENTLHLGSNTGSQTYIRAVKSGAVELYHSGNLRFSTLANGNRLDAAGGNFNTTASTTIGISAQIKNSSQSSNNNGDYKGAIGFTTGTTNNVRSAIAAKQTHTSANRQGIAFLVHPDTTVGTLSEALVLNHDSTATFGAGVDVTGTLTATTLAGTLSTAAQTNITSLGTLSSLTVNGDITLTENDKIKTAESSGGSHLLLRSDNLGVTGNSLSLISLNDILIGAKSNQSGTGNIYFGYNAENKSSGSGWVDTLTITESGNFEFNDGNFTEVGTINSGAITASGNISSSGVATPEFELVPTGSVGNADIKFDGTSLDIRSNSSGAFLTLQTATTERLKITNTGNFEFNNGNLSEIGTISSGAISATSLNLNSRGVATMTPKIFSIADTSSNSGRYIKFGTISGIAQNGRTVVIKVHSNNGFNAADAQNQETIIRFKTSNNNSNQSGFYGDCQKYDFGNNVNAPSSVLVKQVSTTEFQFYGLFSSFTGSSSIYIVEHDSGTWTHDGSDTGASAPTGTVLTATERVIFQSGTTNQSQSLSVGNLLINSTTVIDGSRNISNIGTISSGNITSSGTYPKLFLNDSQGVARSFSVGTNNETFTIRNETGSSDSFKIDNSNKATFNSVITIPASVPSSKGGKALRFPVDADISGTTELEFFTPLSSPASTLTVNNTLTAGAIDIPSNGTNDTRIEIGTSPLANHNAFIDLVGDTTYTDYGLRLIRFNGGANTASKLIHRGTGSLFVEAQDAGNVILKTNGSNGLTINSSQNATFTGNITFGDGHSIGDDADDNLLIAGSANENIIIDSADDIILDADGGDILFKDAGSLIGFLSMASSNLNLTNNASDGDIIFTGNDGGSSVTALTLDMSNAGAATFNSTISSGDITVNTNGRIGTAGGETFIAHNGTTDSGIRFRGSGEIIPATFAGTGSSGVTDLGSAGFKFRNLHLSGTISSGAITSTGTIKSQNTSGTNRGVQLTINGEISQTSSDASFLHLQRYHNGRVAIGNNSNSFLYVKNYIDVVDNYRLNNTVIVDSSRNLTNIGTISSGAITASGTFTKAFDVGNSITLGNDGTFGTSGTGRYVAVGFSGANNGSNRIFAHNTGSDGIYIAAATGRGITFRAGGSSVNHFAFTSTGTMQVNNTTILNQSRELVNIGTISSGAITTSSNLNISGDIFGTGNFDIRSTGNIFNTYGNSSSVFFRTQDGTNRLQLTSAGVLACANDVAAFSSLSDIRLKENIELINNPLNKIKSLRGVNFSYKKDGRKSTGLIAQELEKVLPNAVYTTQQIDDHEDIKAIRYGNVVGLLVEAIKEQQEQIEELKAKLEEVA